MLLGKCLRDQWNELYMNLKPKMVLCFCFFFLPTMPFENISKHHQRDIYQIKMLRRNRDILIVPMHVVAASCPFNTESPKADMLWYAEIFQR